MLEISVRVLDNGGVGRKDGMNIKFRRVGCRLNRGNIRDSGIRGVEWRSMNCLWCEEWGEEEEERK